jgi:hypothetical protein
VRAASGIVLLLASCTCAAEPFHHVDQHPLLAGLVLQPSRPARLPAAQAFSLDAQLAWSSTAVVQQRSNEQLTVDTESQEWRITGSYAVSNRWLLTAELPYRRTSGGSLDSFVENWHGFFGLPNGDRGQLPQDALRISYQRDGNSLLNITNDASGVGDIALAAGYALSQTPVHATTLWLTAKLPIGDSDELTGNDAANIGVALAHERSLGEYFCFSARLSVDKLGRGDVLSNQQRNWLYQGLVSLDWLFAKSLTLTAQLDTRSAAFSGTDLQFLGAATVLTLGGTFHFPAAWHLQLGVAEDLEVEASPDFTLLFNLRKNW